MNASINKTLDRIIIALPTMATCVYDNRIWDYLDAEQLRLAIYHAFLEEQKKREYL